MLPLFLPERRSCWNWKQGKIRVIMQSSTDFSSKRSEALSHDDNYDAQHVTQEASAQTPSVSATDSDHVPANAAATGVQKTTTKANESLFVCFTLLSFYQMRHGHWWLAGLFGLLASLTRSAGLFLLLPFCYEYLRQHHFKLKMIRLDILAGLGIPAGIGVFAIYCYFQFHDLLAFLHQEAIWHPRMQIPGDGILLSISFIRRSSGLLSFQALHNMFDLIPALIIFVLLILSFVGPWKLPSSLWAYSIYAVALYVFFQLYPTVGIFPLQSVGRYMLEVFPAFIILASMGKSRTLHLSYLMTSGI